jgi:uncharacterized membrane protein
MGRAEKFSMLQSQLLMWSLVAVVAYLFATNVSVVLAVALVAPLLVLYGWIVWRIIRGHRSSP